MFEDVRVARYLTMFIALIYDNESRPIILYVDTVVFRAKRLRRSD